MKIVLTTLFLFIAHYLVLGQTQIAGIILDQQDQPITGANIWLKDTYDGTSSTTAGEFSFNTNENGSQILMVSMIGYHTHQQTMEIDGTSLQLTIKLKGKIDKMQAVTISAGAMEASDLKKAVVMKPLDVVTTPGAVGDVVGAFQKLPGTATVGNDGRLFVRGGDASETNIYFDGLQVGNAFGTTAPNIPTRARFNPNLFQGSFFSTGGYSAEFGQALSSVLVLNSIDMPLRTQTDISLMSVGASLSQSLVGENQALTGSASYSNLKPYQAIIQQNITWLEAPESWNAELLGRRKWGKNGIIKAFLNTEQSSFSLLQPQPGQTESQQIDIRNNYYLGNLSFKQTLADTWTINGGFSYSWNKDHIDLDQMLAQQRSGLAHAKLVLVKDFSHKLAVKNGLEYYHNQFNQTQSDRKRQINNQFFNHFIEADYYFNQNLVTRTGLRTTYNQFTGQFWVTPRASLALKTHQHGQFSLAYGQFKQLPQPNQLIQAYHLNNTSSTHYLANYLYNHNGKTFRVEAFYKNYQHLVRFDSLSEYTYFDLSNEGEGYSRGLDLFYRDNRTLPRTDFWITYSLIDSKRAFHQFDQMVQPGFAPRHNASLVIKHFVPFLSSQLGGSYSWNEGYPYHNPNLPGQMQEKTRAFNNLSLSWSYLPRPNLIIHLECTNVLGADNLFGYQYAPEPNEMGIIESLPIRQTADRFLFLGIFMTLSEDKKANQLNNL
ncbi:MAG: TonB-dependent receptor [Candidatus Cyclobacteriaceae bacterium M3_2C_046]